jgi:hypothetical protein
MFPPILVLCRYSAIFIRNSYTVKLDRLRQRILAVCDGSETELMGYDCPSNYMVADLDLDSTAHIMYRHREAFTASWGRQ